MTALSPFRRLLLAATLLPVAGFGARFALRLNFEFLIYVGVILAAFAAIALTRRRVDYADRTLAALSLWSLLHLCGGGVPVGDGRLYDVMLVRLSSSLPVLRYDQVVHAWGFGACTLLAHDLLKRRLGPGRPGFAVPFVCACAGMGLGAVNEVVEFVVDTLLPASGVGGYQNTALDLCANLIGATAAALLLRHRHTPESP